MKLCRKGWPNLLKSTYIFTVWVIPAVRLWSFETNKEHSNIRVMSLFINLFTTPVKIENKNLGQETCVQSSEGTCLLALLVYSQPTASVCKKKKWRLVLSVWEVNYWQQPATEDYIDFLINLSDTAIHMWQQLWCDCWLFEMSSTPTRSV